MAQDGVDGTAVNKTSRNHKVLLWTLRVVPALLLLGFILLNRHAVQVRFLLWEVHTSLIWALTTAAGLGFILGYFAHRIRK